MRNPSAIAASLFFLAAVTSLLLAVPSTVADGSGSDRDPACDGDQDSLGYGRIPSTNSEDGPGGPVETRTCEGEHWDGQDSTAPYFGDSGSCLGTDLDPWGPRVAFWRCAEPNRYQGPASGRMTSTGIGGTAPEVYAAARAAPVAVLAGNVALCATSCATQSEAQGFVGARAAVYYQDDAERNIPFQAVHAIGLTSEEVADSDCTQAQYEAARTDESACRRDNTAITASVVLTDRPPSDPGSLIPDPSEVCPEGSSGSTVNDCLPPPLRNLKLKSNTDGSWTLYDDRNGNDEVDPGETIARIG